MEDASSHGWFHERSWNGPPEVTRKRLYTGRSPSPGKRAAVQERRTAGPGISRLTELKGRVVSVSGKRSNTSNPNQENETIEDPQDRRRLFCLAHCSTRRRLRPDKRTPPHLPGMSNAEHGSHDAVGDGHPRRAPKRLARWQGTGPSPTRWDGNARRAVESKGPRCTGGVSDGRQLCRAHTWEGRHEGMPLRGAATDGYATSVRSLSPPGWTTLGHRHRVTRQGIETTPERSWPRNTGRTLWDPEAGKRKTTTTGAVTHRAGRTNTFKTRLYAPGPRRQGSEIWSHAKESRRPLTAPRARRQARESVTARGRPSVGD